MHSSSSSWVGVGGVIGRQVGGEWREGAGARRWGWGVWGVGWEWVVVGVEVVRGCCRYAMWPWVMVVAVMSQEAVMGACRAVVSWRRVLMPMRC
ncbi:hypothetical protein FUT78_07000 [Xylella fastidiosa subsp. fastidiosa]|nr:hypothetical protein [Xylella fastidiosa subsp. fastidiosa]